MKPAGIKVRTIRPGKRAEIQSYLGEKLRGGQRRIDARIGAAKDVRAVDGAVAAIAKGHGQFVLRKDG